LGVDFGTHLSCFFDICSFIAQWIII